MFVGSVSEVKFNELEVYKQYYASLLNKIDEIDELLEYFVQEKILTYLQLQEICDCTSSFQKITILLSTISESLKAGDCKEFYVMLKIMKTYGAGDTQLLADQIIAKVDKSKLPQLGL